MRFALYQRAHRRQCVEEKVRLYLRLQQRETTFSLEPALARRLEREPLLVLAPTPRLAEIRTQPQRSTAHGIEPEPRDHVRGPRHQHVCGR